MASGDARRVEEGDGVNPFQSQRELDEEIRRVSAEVDKALKFLYETSRKAPEADSVYRMRKSQERLRIESELADNGIKATVPSVDARVMLEVGNERLEAKIQESMRDAAREAVRSRRAQLSALQSISAGMRAEAELAR